MIRNHDGTLRPPIRHMVTRATNSRYHAAVEDGIAKHRQMGDDDARAGLPCRRTQERLGGLWYAPEGWHYENAWQETMRKLAKTGGAGTPMLPGFNATAERPAASAGPVQPVVGLSKGGEHV